MGSPCFLCSKPMRAGEDTNREHIPARSFYPSEIRRQFNPDLDCLQVHSACNSAIKRDEEYFLASFGPMAAGDVLVGPALLRDLKRGIEDDPSRRALAHAILQEFSIVQGTDGSRLKTHDPKRAGAVLWKIVRGLAFLDTGGKLLMEPNAPRFIQIFPTADSITDAPGWLSEALQGETMGKYGRILDYRVKTFVDFADSAVSRAWQVWTLLLWNRVVAVVAFHAPSCPCQDCQDAH